MNRTTNGIHQGDGGEECGNVSSCNHCKESAMHALSPLPDVQSLRISPTKAQRGGEGCEERLVGCISCPSLSLAVELHPKL